MESVPDHGPTKRIAPDDTIGKLATQVLIFGFIIAVFSLIFLGSLVIMAFLLLCAGAATVYARRDHLRAMLNWHTPDLEVTTGGYRLGEEATVVYRRASKRPTDIPEFTLRATLVCQELVRYRQGTDTETETRRVHSHSVEGVGEGDKDGLLGSVSIYITPHAGMPTFKSENNEVTWYVEIETEAPRLPVDRNRFEIDVSGVIAARPVQDS